MDQATRDRLNALNRELYTRHAQEWARSRARAWPGMARAVAEVTAAAPRVLDVGCGHGRLVPVLVERFGAGFEYTGVDFSPELLALAASRHGGPRRRFERGDFVTEAPDRALPSGRFDLVAIFAVLHHVPGEDQRRELLRAASQRLAPSGLLALTLWRFDRSTRLQSRQLQHTELAALGIDIAQLEPGDEILRFGDDPRALRFFHLIDDAELSRVLSDLPLQVVRRFASDGENDVSNDYVLLRSALE